MTERYEMNYYTKEEMKRNFNVNIENVPFGRDSNDGNYYSCNYVIGELPNGTRVDTCVRRIDAHGLHDDERYWGESYLYEVLGNATDLHSIESSLSYEFCKEVVNKQWCELTAEQQERILNCGHNLDFDGELHHYGFCHVDFDNTPLTICGYVPETEEMEEYSDNSSYDTCGECEDVFIKKTDEVYCSWGDLSEYYNAE